MKPTDENKLLYYCLGIFIIATYISIALGEPNAPIAIGVILTIAYFIMRSGLYEQRVEHLKEFA